MDEPLDVEAAYRDYGHVVLRRARAVLGDETEAREALQEVFLSLLDKPNQFSGTSSMTTFLYRATTNLCFNKLRNKRTRSRLLAEKVAPAISEAGSHSMDNALSVRRLLATLSPRLGKVAVYYYLDEMTHAEIADIMQISRRQVGNLVTKIEQFAQQQERAA